MQHGDGKLDDSGAVARTVDLGAEVRDTCRLGYLMKVVVDTETESCEVTEWSAFRQERGSGSAPRRWLTWRP